MSVVLPQEFIANMRQLLGAERFAVFADAMHCEPPVSVRLNPFKAPLSGLGLGRTMRGFDAAVPWAPEEGAYLLERPPFTFDPLFHAGAYYVQEASSMFLHHALKAYQTRPATVLDLCAAPGGKSTLLRSLLPNGSLLVANEVMSKRVGTLLQNVVKWGHADVVITNSRAQDFAALPHFFDLILADVPCSGEGMFRKDGQAVEQWSLENVRLCSSRQREIVRAVWPSLKPGGLMVYSTCTFNTHENEDNVRWIADELGAEVVEVNVDPKWGILGNLPEEIEAKVPIYRFLPGLIRGEGFFLAVLQKGEKTMDSGYSAAVRKKDVRHSTPVPPVCKSWLLNPDEFIYRTYGSSCYAVRAVHIDKVEMLRKAVRVVGAGIKLCEQKGNVVVPSHALAMSLDFNRDSFPEMEVSYDMALTYLCKKTFIANSGTEKGIVTVVYQNLPLGFVKNLGTRVNNLYPLECKIRTSFLTNYKLRTDF